MITVDCTVVGDEAKYTCEGDLKKVLADGLTLISDAQRIVDALACGLMDDASSIADNPKDVSGLLFTTWRILERAEKLVSAAFTATEAT